MRQETRTGEYSSRGEYHRSPSKDWSYYPLYLSKKELVMGLLEAMPRGSRILDVGCGEGVFVEELASRGFANVSGIDENYSSGLVRKGSALEIPEPDGGADAVLFLDVVEHIAIERQAAALAEIGRVLKDGGVMVASIPNLAHLASRVRFLLRGKLVRTASAEKHPGDRPISEFVEMIRKAGFSVESRKGFFPTVPFLYKAVQRRPARYMWLYRLLNLALPFPGLCFLNILVCRKTGRAA